MKRLSRIATLLAVGLILTPTLVQAAGPEQVVVRNRNFSTAGQFEASVGVGFSLLDYLTSHINFGGSLTYHFAEPYALVLLGGYTASSQTSSATEVAKAFGAGDLGAKSSDTVNYPYYDDFSDLWQMNWNAGLAFQWSPIYGKMNVAAELPVNFKLYLLAGGGVGGFERTSVVYCLGDPTPKIQNCVRDATGDNLGALFQEATKPIAIGGIGMRFFVYQSWSLSVELRDIVFQDEHQVAIPEADMANALPEDANNPTTLLGKTEKGFTHLPFIQIGASFLF